MYPTLFTTPSGMGVHVYGLFIMLAFCSAFLLVHLRAPKVGIEPDKLLWTYAAAAVGGMLGARFLYAVAVDFDELLANPLSLFSMSGFAVYGGVIGGAVAVGLTAANLSIPLWKLADIAAPSVLVGYGVGRIGCFFAGCCHGVVAPSGGTPLLPENLLHGQLYALPNFPFLTSEVHDGVGRLLHQPLYPTQLWMATEGLLLTALMVWMWKHRTFDGQVAGIALILEGPSRAFIEAYRADERGVVYAFDAPQWAINWLPGMFQAGADQSAQIGVTTSQTIAVGMVLLGLSILVLQRNKGVAPEIPIVVDENSA